MSTKRTTITISPELYERALRVMQARLIDDFSGFVQILIREEWDRRGFGTYPPPAVSPLANNEPTNPAAMAAEAAEILVKRETDKADKVSRKRKPTS